MPIFAAAKAWIAGNKIAVYLGCALAASLLLAGTYFKGRADGASGVRAEYAQKVLEAAQAAREASETATASKDERDKEFALEQAEIEDAVKEAIDSGNDPVGAYFDQLRCTSGGGCEAASE